MYFNPNLCKHMRCPWLAEVQLMKSGWPSLGSDPHTCRLSYASFGPDYVSCQIDVTTIVDSPQHAPAELQMPACLRTGFVQFSVPDTCPNVMEQSILDPPNIVASQEDQAP